MAPNTLLDLPNELLTMIVSEVEASYPSDGIDDDCQAFSFRHKDTSTQYPRSKDLTAIATTCRSLRAITEPFLYRAPTTSPSQACRMLLLRTLVEQPDLSPYVRELFIKDYKASDSDLLPLDSEIYKAAADRLGLTSSADAVEPGHTLRGQLPVRHLIPALVAGNLESIKYSPTIGLSSTDTLRDANVNFPRVRCLSIAPFKGYEIYEQSLRASWYQELMALCPNLQYLRLGRCISLPRHLDLSSLRVLRIARADFSVTSFEQFLSSCPNLEDIGIHHEDVDLGGGSRYAPKIWLAQFSRFLWPLQGKLRHLYLMPDRIWDRFGSDDLLDSMDDFRKLETLVLNPRSFVGLDLDADPTAADCERLLHKLPKSVKYLALPDMGGYTGGWDTSLWHSTVAGAVKDGMFPHLTKLALARKERDHKSMDEWQELKSNFAAMGVSLHAINWANTVVMGGDSLGGPPEYDLKPGPNFLRPWPNSWEGDSGDA